MNPALNRNFEHEARVRRVRIERNLPINVAPIRWKWIKGEADCDRLATGGGAA